MPNSQDGRNSPPPSYNSINFALRLPRRRSNRDSNRIRRLQYMLVVGNWVCILGFVAAAVMICIPVFVDDLSTLLETTIRVLGYCLMGVIAFIILFLNCVVRRMVVLETLRFNQRQRRRIISTVNAARRDGQTVQTVAETVADAESGHPTAYIGPYGLNAKNEPYGLPTYENAIALSPPAYTETDGASPSNQTLPESSCELEPNVRV